MSVGLILLLIGLSHAPLTVHAQQAATGQTNITRDQAAKQALARHGAGKVLGVRKKTRADGSAYYEVKILTDGQVSIYKIDA